MPTYGSQFIRGFMFPLIEQVLTDTKNNRAGYLSKKLFSRDKLALTPGEKDDFYKNYFEPKLQAWKFCQSDEFRTNFLENFREQIQLRLKLSGLAGASQVLLPDENGNFSAEGRRTLYKLAYRISVKFEQAEINKLIDADEADGKITKEVAASNKELVENGKMKLIFDENEPHYISEDEAKAAATDPELKNRPMAALIPVGSSAEDPSGKAGMTYGDKKFQNEFVKTQETAIEMVMEQNGLAITKDIKIDANGIATGQVKDASGQLLTIKINTKLRNSNNSKITLTFVNGNPKGGRDTITMSQTNLTLFKEQSAVEVADMKLPGVVTEARKPIPKLPVKARPKIARPLTAGEEGFEGTLAVTIKGKVEPGGIAGVKGRVKAPVISVAKRPTLPKKAAAPVVVERAKPTTVMARKEELMAKKRVAAPPTKKRKARKEEKPQAPPMAPTPPPAGPPPAVVARRRPQTPKRNPWAVAAVVGNVGGIGGVGGLTAWNVFAEGAEKVVSILATCMGFTCIS